jgi:ribosomal protein L37AE/L43A
MAKRKRVPKTEEYAGFSIECPYCGKRADFVEYDELGRKIYYCYECDAHIIEGDE